MSEIFIFSCFQRRMGEDGPPQKTAKQLEKEAKKAAEKAAKLEKLAAKQAKAASDKNKAGDGEKKEKKVKKDEKKEAAVYTSVTPAGAKKGQHITSVAGR